MKIFKLGEQGKNAKPDKAVGIGIAKFISSEIISAGVAVIEKRVNAHYHKDGEEIYLILEGEGMMYLGAPKGDGKAKGKAEWEKPTRVKEGDCFLVPKGAAHSLKNTGGKKLVIAFFSAPPFGSDRVIVGNPE